MNHPILMSTFNTLAEKKSFNICTKNTPVAAQPLRQQSSPTGRKAPSETLERPSVLTGTWLKKLPATYLGGIKKQA